MRLAAYLTKLVLRIRILKTPCHRGRSEQHECSQGSEEGAHAQYSAAK